MAPGTQLTITFDVGAKISTLRPCHRFPRRFEEPTEAKADAMDVDDDNGAAPMLVEPRPAENRLQPMSDELDGDGAPATEDGVLLLPRGLFDALDDDDVPPAPSDPADFFPSRRRVASLGEDSSDDESVDSLLDSDSDSEDDVASWALDSVRLFREQDAEPPAELAEGLKAVDLDAMFGYAVRPNPRVTEEERWKEDDAEPLVVAPAASANVLGEFVRGSSSPLDLTSGGPARGLHAPPGPNGLLQGRHVPPALLPPHRPLTYPACRFLFSPQLIRSCNR